MRRLPGGLAVLFVALAFLNARVDGLRPGHVCPMAAVHQQASGSHGSSHHMPAQQDTPHGPCPCDGPGCCSASAVALPVPPVRLPATASARRDDDYPVPPTTPFLTTRRDPAAARAPPITL